MQNLSCVKSSSSLSFLISHFPLAIIITLSTLFQVAFSLSLALSLSCSHTQFNFQRVFCSTFLQLTAATWFTCCCFICCCRPAPFLPLSLPSLYHEGLQRGKIVGNSIWRKLENANGNSNANRLQWRPTAFWPQIQSHLKRMQPPLSFPLPPPVSLPLSPFPAHLGLPSRLEPHVYPWNLIGCTAHRAKAATAAEG